MKKVFFISLILVTLIIISLLGYTHFKKSSTPKVIHYIPKGQDIPAKQNNEQNYKPITCTPEATPQSNTSITISPVISGGEIAIPTEFKNLYGNNMSNLIAGGIACKTENGVVFTSFEEGKQLKRIDKNGELTPLGNFSAEYINSDGKFLYFCSTEGGVWGGKVHKLNLTNHTDEIIFDGSAKHLILYGEYLYFCDNTIGYSGILTKMKKDGTEKTELTNRKCSYINIVDNWIYYVASNGMKKHEIRAISIDGANDKILQSNIDLSRNLNYYNDYLYYLDFHKNIVRVKVDGSAKEEYISGAVDSFIIQNDFLFYLTTDDGFRTIIHQRDLTDDSEKQITILEYVQDEISIIDNWLYMYFTYPDSVLSYAGRYNIITEKYEYLDEKN